MAKVAICVCTYKRPKELRRLMDSIALLMPGGCEITLFIADNDPVGHEGFNFVKKHGKKYPYPVVCEIEAGVGISRARNRTLAMVKASGVSFDYVAFTDDDVEVSPFWLRDLIRTCTLYGADAVGGKQEPLFEKAPNLEVLNSGFFRENFRTEPTGQRIESAATNNLLVRYSVFEKEGFCPFDEYLGTFGGSDEGFVMRLLRRGYLIVKCASGVVYETLTPSRASM